MYKSKGHRKDLQILGFLRECSKKESGEHVFLTCGIKKNVKKKNNLLLQY